MALKMTLRQIPGLRRALLVLVGSAAGFGLALPGQAQTAEANTAAANAGSGGKGAQIYCFMRSSGNSHQVSWDAAYAVIKRQNDKLFKTSPEHAAVMITEAVVQNPSVFPDCGRYLGDLFAKPEAKPEASTSSAPSGASRSERLGQEGSPIFMPRRLPTRLPSGQRSRWSQCAWRALHAPRVRLPRSARHRLPLPRCAHRDPRPCRAIARVVATASGAAA